ncbi:MAG: glycoside hydrolase family 9 protein [Firmicutes bacterium]|nr:glycoside hydrolase family 9 protein [Bacillota bacterium]
MEKKKSWVSLFMQKIVKRTSRVRLPVRKIKVNQAGYLPSEKKIFLYTRNVENLAGTGFKVIRASDGKVFKGRLGQAVLDQDSGDRNYHGDFSFLTQPGRYTIKINSDESHSFEITGCKYHDLLYLSMRSYYLQRCGVGIDDKISGVSHAPCHLKDSYPYDDASGKQIDTTGGWHDAGDYGKYIPSAAVTVAQLLLMYELGPRIFDAFSLDIPKTKGSEHLSDFLTELKYELDWMLKMQDTQDGGVYYKVASHDFPSFDIAPEDDVEIRYYFSKGTAVTANFAGVTAMAARVFEEADSKYAEKLRKASIQAGEFLLNTNGKVIEPSYGVTGAYLTTSVKDDLCWAYAELYRLTGKKDYWEMVLQNLENNFDPVIDWNNFTFLAINTLLACPETPVELREKWLLTLTQWVEKIRARIAGNGYHVALTWEEYTWSSTKRALGYGVSLILAQKFLGGDFNDEIKSQLDYILGVNPLSKVYITKVGTDFVRYPHHRLAESKGALVPGLLVGGPNNRAEDGLYFRDLGPRGYVDLAAACSCNEPAIDYNAPLVFVAGYLWMREEMQIKN